ncbi:MAG: DUF2332 domain-containing protein [Candidatus Tectimicrobiota bacterium]
MRERDAIRRQYQAFADTECRGYSDLYYRLACGAAEDEAMLRFIADQPVQQPNLFFAAVHYVTGTVGMPATITELKALLAQRGADVAALMATRRTQTNEVGRCAVLLPTLPAGPLALVEVGASAGLCLLLDRFSYEYGAARLGLPASPVRLQCALAGTAPLPQSTPEVVWRRGLDLAPLDVYDEEAVRWLLACVWPDHPARRDRLEAAIALARTDPPCVQRGDLVDDLGRVLAEAPQDARLVVFHSAVLAYVSPQRRAAFAQVLADASRQREIVWVANEALGVLARLAGSPATAGRQQFLVVRTTFAHGVARRDVLALAHPHGAEMTWLAGVS